MSETQEPTPSPSRPATRAERKKRREARLEWQESYFQLLSEGFSLQQIAAAKTVSVAKVRRAVDRAIARRRFDAPERFVHLQLARLTKALRVADACLEKGDRRAIAPYLKVIAELDRYSGVSARIGRSTSRAAGIDAPVAPPLTLTRAPGLALRACSGDISLKTRIKGVA